METKQIFTTGQIVCSVNNHGRLVSICFSSSEGAPWIKVDIRIAFRIAYLIVKYSIKAFFSRSTAL